jgi:hypothetical protein
MAEALRQAFLDSDKGKSGCISIPSFTIALNTVDPNIFHAGFISKILEVQGVVVQGKVKYDCFLAWLDGTSQRAESKRCGRVQDADQAALFMERWDAYKNVANAVVAKGVDGVAKPVDQNNDGRLDAGEKFLSMFDADGDGIVGPSEYEAMETAIADEWKKSVDFRLQKRAQESGATIENLQQAFVDKHIGGIQSKGFVLSDMAKKSLGEMLKRFYICDVGPAPFSIHSVEEMTKAGMDVDDLTVSVSQHCLQMAMHWLRNPPDFLNVGELEELVVLALFHDVYYYDDFTRHGILPVEQLEPFLLHEVPKSVVGGHLHRKPIKEALKTGRFASPVEALEQEWVQMDWYLTLVNVKHEATRAKRVGDGVIAPLEFFHYHLGHFFTKGQHVVVQAKGQSHNW